jgi:long-chain acyl-CoA synthetase
MEKPWLQHYPAGVPANINPDAYARVTDMLDECFVKYKDRPAFYFMGKMLTFKQVDDMAGISARTCVCAGSNLATVWRS